MHNPIFAVSDPRWRNCDHRRVQETRALRSRRLARGMQGSTEVLPIRHIGRGLPRR